MNIEYIYDGERKTLPFSGGESELIALKETGYMTDSRPAWRSVTNPPVPTILEYGELVSRVVLATNGKDLVLAYRRIEDGMPGAVWKEYQTDTGLAGLTHWMPIPRLP